MLKVILFSLVIITSSLAATSNLKNTQIPRPPRPPMVMAMAITPSGGAGNSFSKDCFNADVRGFTLYATCKDANGDERNASVSFGNCIKNYDGNLSAFNGSTDELYSKDCFTNGTRLICQCQQTAGGYRSCSVRLNDYFKVNNGQLTC